MAAPHFASVVRMAAERRISRWSARMAVAGCVAQSEAARMAGERLTAVEVLMLVAVLMVVVGQGAITAEGVGRLSE
jgi:hypothetical protein